MIDFGREITGDLGAAERREWLCANGVGGFASGTVAGSLTRRYHGLLVAALKPPLGRTLLASKVEDRIEYGGTTHELSVNRWTDGTIAPTGHRALERFHLEGTTPVWTYACHEALVEKRVWMEPGANTTYVQYRLVRGQSPVQLELKALANYRDYHGTTRGDGWTMAVTCASSLETAARGQWVCEHRDPSILRMVSFRHVVAGTSINHWWDNGANAIAFSRGDKGFVAINDETTSLDTTISTGMAAGTYLDLISGNPVQLDPAGSVHLTLAPRSALAIDTATRQ